MAIDEIRHFCLSAPFLMFQCTGMFVSPRLLLSPIPVDAGSVQALLLLESLIGVWYPLWVWKSFSRTESIVVNCDGNAILTFCSRFDVSIWLDYSPISATVAEGNRQGRRKEKKKKKKALAPVLVGAEQFSSDGGMFAFFLLFSPRWW